MKPNPKLELMTYDYEAHAISFLSDGHVNLTEMCQAYDKEPYSFLRNDATRRFIAALAADTGLDEDALVITRRGGNQVHRSADLRNGEWSKLRIQGTWAHRDLALECARWLSPKLAIWTNRIILGLMSGQNMHPAMDHRSLAKVEGLNLAKLREVKESRIMLYARLDVPGTVSFLAYRLTVGLPGTPLLGARIGELARQHALAAGMAVGVVRQSNPSKTKNARVNTYPIESLYAAWIHLGYDHEKPTLEAVEALWRPMLPYYHRLNKVDLLK